MKVYRKVLVSERLPTSLWVLTPQGGFNFINGKFKCPHNGTIQEGIEYWLEEIELPSEEEIQEVAPNVRCVNQFWNGVNFILNKIKWRQK